MEEYVDTSTPNRSRYHIDHDLQLLRVALIDVSRCSWQDTHLLVDVCYRILTSGPSTIAWLGCFAYVSEWLAMVARLSLLCSDTNAQLEATKGCIVGSEWRLCVAGHCRDSTASLKGSSPDTPSLRPATNSPPHTAIMPPIITIQRPIFKEAQESGWHSLDNQSSKRLTGQ